MPTPLNPADVAAISHALSRPRFGRYLAETDGNAAKALALYDWNARVSAAFLHPLHIFEVMLRNGVAAAIEAEHGPDWHVAPRFLGSLPNVHRRMGMVSGPRKELQDTVAKVTREMQRRLPPGASKPVKVPAGKVVAEMKFYFWSGLLTARHDAAIWNKHFLMGFPGAPATGPGGIPRRRRLHEEAEAVREFRNRVAHHEPVLTRNLRSEYARILRVVRWRDRATAAWLHGGAIGAGPA